MPDQWIEEAWLPKRWMDVLSASGLRVQAEEEQKAAERTVEELRVFPGRIACKTAGHRSRPYRIEVGLPVFTPQERDRALRVFAERAAFSAALLNGDMPDALERDLQQAGVSLFPEAIEERAVTCSCGAGSGICEHAAAALMAFGTRMAADPFLLCEARGLSRESLLTGLRELRSASVHARGLCADGNAASGSPDGHTEDAERNRDRLHGERRSGDMPRGGEALAKPDEDAPALLVLAGDPDFWRKDTALHSLLLPIYRKVKDTAGRLLDTAAHAAEQEEGRQWNGE